jgi:iron complex transport system ATP-binding protein
MNRVPGQILLEARNIRFAFSRLSLENISLNLVAGQVSGIIGPNGSGKTTILRLLDGILRPLSGEVILAGMGPLGQLRRKEVAQHIAMVPQNGGLDCPLTVFEFAMLGRSPHLSFLGFESSHDEEIVQEALALTDMETYRESRVSEISGGEKQRLLLARALAQQPRILLLDELTANLDINFQVELMGLVRRITREQNLATLIVSHEITLLSSFADEVALISSGQMVGRGTVREVITPENLKRMFGLDFKVRDLGEGAWEVLPVMRK